MTLARPMRERPDRVNPLLIGALMVLFGGMGGAIGGWIGAPGPEEPPGVADQPPQALLAEAQAPPPEAPKPPAAPAPSPEEPLGSAEVLLRYIRAKADEDGSCARASEPLTRALRSQIKAYTACYARALGRSPSLEGKVLLDLDLDLATGRVSPTVRWPDGPGDGEMGACFQRVAAGIDLQREKLGFAICPFRASLGLRSQASPVAAPEPRPAPLASQAPGGGGQVNRREVSVVCHPEGADCLKAELERFVDQRLEHISACYRDLLITRPHDHGRMDIMVQLAKNPAQRKIWLDQNRSVLRTTEAVRCAKRYMTEATNLPPPEGTTRQRARLSLDFQLP